MSVIAALFGIVRLPRAASGFKKRQGRLIVDSATFAMTAGGRAEKRQAADPGAGRAR